MFQRRRTSRTSRTGSAANRRSPFGAELLERRTLLSGGGLDFTFGTEGKVLTEFRPPIPTDDLPAEIVVLDDGRVVVAGGEPGGNTPIAKLARYLPGGALDPSFGAGGRLSTPLSELEGLLALPGGKLLAVGDKYGPVKMVRYNPDGTRDVTFGVEGVVTPALPRPTVLVTAAALAPDGKIVVSGVGGSDYFVARFNPDGTPDAAFGPDGNGFAFADFGGSDRARALALTSGGKAVVAGYTDIDGLQRHVAIARFNADGSLDATFDGDGLVRTDVLDGFSDTAWALAAQPDGRLVVGGDAARTLPQREQFHTLVRYNDDGSLDRTFDGDGKVVVRYDGTTRGNMYGVNALAVDAGGNLLAAGLVVDSAAGAVRLAGGIIRYRPDGSRDASFGDPAAGNAAVATFDGRPSGASAVTLGPAGSVLLAGMVGTWTGGVPDTDFGLARFTADGVPDGAFGGPAAGGPAPGSVVTTFTRPADNTEAQANAAAQQPDGKLVVVGVVNVADIGSGVPRGNDFAVARYDTDGTLDRTFGEGGRVVLNFSLNDYSVEGVSVLPGGRILVVGITSGTGVGDFTDTALVRLNADGTPDTTFGPGGRRLVVISPGNETISRVVFLPDGSMLIAGRYWPAEPEAPAAPAVARVNADGTLDGSFGTGGRALLERGEWQAQEVTEVIALPDGGVLTSTSGFSAIDKRAYLHRLAADGSPDASFGAAGHVTVDGRIDRCELTPDGKIVTAGQEITAGFASDVVLRRFNGDGSSDAAFGAGGRTVTDLGLIDSPHDLLVMPDGTIYCGGAAGAVNGATGTSTPPSTFLARYGPGGLPDPSFGLGGVVRTGVANGGDWLIGLFLQADGRVVSFGRADRKFFLARYGPDAPIQARAGGPYAGTEGQPLQLDGGASDYPGSSIVRYDWDLDYNLVDFDVDATGAAASAVPDDSSAGPRRMALRVVGADGASHISLATVTVANVAPHADFVTVADPAVEGQRAPVARFVNPQDVPGDLRRGLSYFYDFNDDGDFSDTGEYGGVGLSVANYAFPDDGQYTIRGRVQDMDGGFTDYRTSITVVNAAPVVNAGPDDTIAAGAPYALGGSFADGADAWTGTVDWGDGSGEQPLPVRADNRTFAASKTYPGPGVYVVTVKVTDDQGAAGTDSVVVRIGQLQGRYVFYNRSSFDGNNANPGAPDEQAVATDKRPLLPGETPSFDNVTSYTRGLNGVMVDLPAGTATAADFEFRVSAPGGTWVAAPAPLAVAVRRNAGANLSDRVHVVWTDGAIRNRWLRVTVKANPRTGLAAPDVFQFGNLVGEAGDGAATATATAGPRVSALDLAAVKRALNTVSSPVTSRIDFDRDGRVNASDLAAARSGLGQALATPPPPPPAAPAAGLAVTYVTREVLDDDQRPNGLA